MNYLSADEVIEIHADQLNRYGGESSGGQRGDEYQGVEAAVQAVKNSYYESLEELAAAYAVYIVQGHVFADGNKRTGAAAMLTFLAANEHELTISMREIAPAMLELQKMAKAGARTDELVAWLADQL